MEQKLLAKSFNQSSPGNQTRKVILRRLANEECLLVIEHHGLTWPKKMARGKPLSYTMGSRQLIIRNQADEVIEKIMLGNITKLTPEKPIDEKSVMRLTIRKND